MSIAVFLAVAGAIAAVFAFVWLRLPEGARQPIAIYVGSYLFTYCIGGVWIGLTNGGILDSYFRDRLYVPAIVDLGTMYWTVLLAPLIVPACIAVALLPRTGRKRATQVSTPLPARVPFIATFVGLVAYAIYHIFNGGNGVVDALLNISTLYGDTTTIIERRLELFGPGTTIAFGIICTGLPALCHVALFHAKKSASWQWIATVAILVTLSLSVATFQVAPAALFMGTLVVSASHVGLVRMTSMKAAAFGIGFLLVLQGMNGWKFADWSLVENLQHLVFRMPSAFPYYLDCFPNTVAFLGTDWIGSLIGIGADPGGPFIVARYMYPDMVAGGAMAAPAQVQAYAEGGTLNALFAVAVVGIPVIAVSLLHRKSKDGAIWHSLYIQGLVSLYYCTQTSFRGVIWHSYGVVWYLAPLLLISALSFRPMVRRVVFARHLIADAVARP